MRIESIETLIVEIPLKPERRMISALGRQTSSRFAVLRLATDDGLVGWGEATVTPRWSGETAWGVKALMDHIFTPALLGVDPLDLDEVEARMDALAFGNWFAKSAVESACWDVAGKAAGRPIYELLGGPVRPATIKNRFSLGAYEPKIAAERAVERVAVGFDTIKVKVGTDPSEDVARVRAVRSAIGESVELTVDANGGWNSRTALECLMALESCRIAIVEQPLPRGDHTGARLLKEAAGCKILADESCFEAADAAELLAQGACDVLSLYPGKQGGIRKARRIALMAEERGVPCTVGSNLEWDVAAAGMMHFIVSTPNMRVDLYPGDCLGPFYHEHSIVSDPLTIAGPEITLREGPGLGVEVDWETARRGRLP